MTFTLEKATFGMVLILFLLQMYAAYLAYSNKENIKKAVAVASTLA